MWVARMMDESKLYKENCTISLTYEKCDGDLHKEHLQKFIKRLRKYLDSLDGRKIRYYGCGEYGGLGNRPHYHICVFNWYPPDARYSFTKNGIRYFESDILNNIWRGYYTFDKELSKYNTANKIWEGEYIQDEDYNEKALVKDKEGNSYSWTGICKGGICCFSRLSEKSCKYTTKYLQKLDDRYHRVEPFTVMSRNGGIGTPAVSEQMLNDGLIYHNGKSFPIPKIYIDKLEKLGYNVSDLKAKRTYIYENSLFANNCESAVDSARERGRHKDEYFKQFVSR